MVYHVESGEHASEHIPFKRHDAISRMTSATEVAFSTAAFNSSKSSRLSQPCQSRKSFSTKRRTSLLYISSTGNMRSLIFIWRFPLAWHSLLCQLQIFPRTGTNQVCHATNVPQDLAQTSFPQSSCATCPRSSTTHETWPMSPDKKSW